MICPICYNPKASEVDIRKNLEDWTRKVVKDFIKKLEEDLE